MKLSCSVPFPGHQCGFLISFSVGFEGSLISLSPQDLDSKPCRFYNINLNPGLAISGCVTFGKIFSSLVGSFLIYIICIQNCICRTIFLSHTWRCCNTPSLVLGTQKSHGGGLVGSRDRSSLMKQIPHFSSF